MRLLKGNQLVSSKDAQILEIVENIEGWVKILLDRKRDPMITSHESVTGDFGGKIRDLENSVGDLKAQVAARDFVIDAVKKAINEKDDEIKELKRQLRDQSK
jgi:peptidoglycan hydrolase CwlO-like protein